MAKETKRLKDVHIFKENDGRWRAVITDKSGIRRNVAPQGCRTRAEARQEAKEWLKWIA